MDDWKDAADELPEVGQITACRVNIWRFYVLIRGAVEGPQFTGEYMGGGTWDFQSNTDDDFYEVTHWRLTVDKRA